MENVFTPNKFEIQFRRTGEDEYTGALFVDGMKMGVGSPKTANEIAAFLMPSKPGCLLFSNGHQQAIN